MKKIEERNYDDIIHLSHPVSKKHPQMSLIDRAAQFSPFAALTGHEEAICETARVVEKQIILDEDEKAVLDERLQVIKAHLSEHPKVAITYFKPDSLKQGGTYKTICDKVKKIDEYENKLVFVNGMEIRFEHLIQIALCES